MGNLKGGTFTMFDWIKENWEKIDAAIENIIAFLKAFLGELGEWPIDVK